jgi:hypothetical protein
VTGSDEEDAAAGTVTGVDHFVAGQCGDELLGTGDLTTVGVSAIRTAAASSVAGNRAWSSNVRCSPRRVHGSSSIESVRTP